MEARGKIRIPVKSLDAPWHLDVLSDIHLGNRGCSLSTLRSTVATIARDKVPGRVILLGDQIDCISPTDKRFDARVLDPEVMALEDLSCVGEALSDAVVRELAPLKGRILGACLGNHELKYMQIHEQARLHARVCERLGCINLELSSLFDLVFVAGKRSATFRVFVHHGSGAASSLGGKINRLGVFMAMAESDIVLTGHTHEMLDHTSTRIGADAACKTLLSSEQLGVVCGTYLRTYTQGVVGYGEVRGYRPTSIGSPRIEIIPATRTMGVRWTRG